MLFTLVGIIYERFKKRIAESEENIAQLESQLLKIKRDMDLAQSWMFGLNDDETSECIASMVESINVRLTTLIDAPTTKMISTLSATKSTSEN